MKYVIGASFETKFTPELLRKIKGEAGKDGVKSIKGLEFEFYPNGEKGHFIKVFIPKKPNALNIFSSAGFDMFNTVEIPVSFKDEGGFISVGYKNELRVKKRR